jgi:hypothetical protein
MGRKMKVRTSEQEMRSIWRVILRLRDGDRIKSGLKTMMEKNIMK